MKQTTGTAPRKVRHIFYFATISLLIGAIAATFIQKQREKTVAIAGATGGNVQQAIQDARHWGVVSVVTVAVAILSWGIAIWRRETHRYAWVPVVLLLSFYVLPELMMV